MIVYRSKNTSLLFIILRRGTTPGYLLTSGMAYPIELILSRQLAEVLAMPVFLTDTAGNLLFYNEPAEEILGKRYEDTGEMQVDEWGTIFKNKDDAGNAIPSEELPLVKTLLNR